MFEIATTREGSDVVLVHDLEVQPRVADQPPPHGHGLEAGWCSCWRRGRLESYREHGDSVLVAA